MKGNQAKESFLVDIRMALEIKLLFMVVRRDASLQIRNLLDR